MLVVLVGAVGAPVVWNMRAVPDVDYGRQIAVIDAALSRLARPPPARRRFAGPAPRPRRILHCRSYS